MQTGGTSLADVCWELFYKNGRCAAVCGIVGIVHKDSRVNPVLLRSMADSVSHRGPDDSGFFFSRDGNVGFGFRRLSIIDLATGHQPMTNEDESVWVMLNGEVYNFQEFRRGLVSKGHVFRTNSDTECVVHGYEEYGTGVFAKLNGMFAIAIWDDKAKKLILARDRAGEKPLHYFSDGSTFVFGSEIKSLLLHPKISKDINLGAIDEYFAYGYIAAPNSIYEGIAKLRPAHYLVYQDSKVTVNSYWEIDSSKQFSGSYDDAKVELYQLLNDAVRIRMASDVPLGAFLSGGIDSSTTVALMALNSPQRIKTFSIGFNESAFDERHFARTVAEKYNTLHTELVLSGDLPLKTIEDIVLNFDEPFGDSSALPTYSVSKLTRGYVTVSLSGDAGDELFAGYPTYPGFVQRKAQLKKIPGVLRGLVSALPYDFGFSTGINKKVSFLRDSDDASRFVTLFSQFSTVERARMFNNEMSGRISEHRARTKDVRYLHFDNSFDLINKMLYSDFKHYLPDDILVKVDRASMLSSLESRAPFLDHRLIEFSFSLPSKWKLEGWDTKKILKDSVRSLLPQGILERGKMGFGVPLKHWFTNELFDYCRSKLTSGPASRIFNRDYVGKYLEVHRTGKRDNSHKLWMLLTFALWAERNGAELS